MTSTLTPDKLRLEAKRSGYLYACEDEAYHCLPELSAVRRLAATLFEQELLAEQSRLFLEDGDNQVLDQEGNASLLPEGFSRAQARRLYVQTFVEQYFWAQAKEETAGTTIIVAPFYEAVLTLTPTGYFRIALHEEDAEACSIGIGRTLTAALRAFHFDTRITERALAARGEA